VILGHASERTTLAIYTHALRRTCDDSAEVAVGRPDTQCARDGVDRCSICGGRGPALAIPGVEMPELGREWPTLREFASAHNLSANDLTDAWIAAAVRTIGSHLVTFDRGFTRLLGRSELTVLSPTNVVSP
jgi:hypothetical protein